MKMRHPRHKSLFHVKQGLLLSVGLFWLALPLGAIAQTTEELVEQGRQLYQSGEFSAAVAIWETAASRSDGEGNRLQQAVALSNLSAALQELGEWERAKAAIAESLALVERETDSPSSVRVLAQALNTRGGLEFTLGQTEAAVTTWEQAADAYRQAGEKSGEYRAMINQARALQALGLYRRSVTRLEQLQARLGEETDSDTKVTALLALGNALRLVGDLEQSEEVLWDSLQTAQRLQSPSAMSESAIALGNTVRARQDGDSALALYQQAAANAESADTQVQARLNALSLLVENPLILSNSPSESLIQSWIPQIQAQIEALPPSRMAVYARIKFAQSWVQWHEGKSSLNSVLPEAAKLLGTAVQQAKSIGDRRAESYALGNLGELYERNRQWQQAQSLTQQALELAEYINAVDIAYRWQWQLGRLLLAQGDRPGAVIAYSQAVNSLESLRLDLVTTNREVQFSFRDSVEPVYRELVALLLDAPSTPANRTSSQGISQENLQKALQAIESLKLAELDNFFRDACVDSNAVELDKQQVDLTAAIIYPIVLGDRLEVIVSLPNQPLKHYSTPLPKEEIEQTLISLRRTLVTRTSRQYRVHANTVYNWLITPIQDTLAASGIKTLVFVPDGLFRNIPMAALYDGEQFLLEKYSVAVSPGLKLTALQPLKRQALKALTAGLSEERFGFAQLPNVALEVEQINAALSGIVLMDNGFTRDTLQQQLLQTPFPVVHIATHGQFSSSAEDTFILAWDDRINVNELDSLLRVRNRSGTEALELLVLSACQTATGDDRAALGLAGMAVRAGARSTLATLWYIDDAATVPLMIDFYQSLNKENLTKSEALRQAQLNLLKNPDYQHPIYWAAYVLVGNWL
ncbi:CHAT domain-containing protein [Laspinema olomoucense]|uniref:CHAT domain-containing protein n=1 Tax=Laspinema olomoucense TaxID=3231600 RepID=UPI0021BB64DB|nr:CHAT domain-containing protein [Laspinema sp. D3a]MCT7989807.1 CHAT domain-containing protein [Laspinema sp. D3a]